MAPTDYTLLYAGRSLKGKMHTQETITSEHALFAMFVYTHASELLGNDAKRAEKKLRRFLGARYNEFLQAFLADEEEQGQFLKVKPESEEIRDEEDNDEGTGLKRLTSHEILGRRVVYFDSLGIPRVYVGRIEEVKHASFSEMVTSGLIADVVLLEADGHEYLANLFFQTYIRGPEPPTSGVYAWPRDLPPQTFRQPKRRGHLISFQMKLPQPISIIVIDADSDGHDS